MTFGSCLLSAALLVLAFPRADWSFLAWFALLPFLCTLDGQKAATAFRRGYLLGFLFFAAAIGWISYVTPVGTFLLVAFLALYFAVFGAAVVYFQRFALVGRILILSALWVALEFVRGHLFSGFGWAMLGHTQYRNYCLIQIADITGVYGISFLVILVNLLLYETWRAKSMPRQAAMMVLSVLFLVLAYGTWVLGQARPEGTVRVGVVQPNIPLAMDWDESKKPFIVEKTVLQTEEISGHDLDLIVWPEMSLPGVITDSPYLTGKIKSYAIGIKTPILIGSIDQDGRHYYNSAFLIGDQGQMLGHYDKIHLVPFGEYLPLRPLLGWINRFVELDDFNFGTNYKIFSLPRSGQRFGVLICFEDTLGPLCRKFALRGAEFFVNMTNDAWFRETRAPFLHLAGAVFGCVENHRSLVRAANTGVSALVDPWGRITATVTDRSGRKIFTQGAAWGVLPLNRRISVYTKYGDFFTYLCFLCIVVAAVRVRQRAA